MTDQSYYLPHFETTLGSYAPHFLRITVERLYDGLERGQRSPNEFRGHEVAAFFHEFIHHLQSISTISGISSLNSTVSLWHNVRNAIDDADDYESLEHIRVAFSNISNYKLNNEKNNTTTKIEIISIDNAAQETIDLSPLKITCLVNNLSVDVEFGIAEFFESAAYSLEKLFRKKINLPDASQETPTVPYKIGELIGDHYSKNFSEVSLVMIMLTASQNASPHRAYAALIKQLAEYELKEEEIRKKLTDQTIKLIKTNENWINQIVTQVKSAFPIGDPAFGDLIIDLFESIKNHINQRLTSPMAELDFLQTLTQENLSIKLVEFINSFGGCIVLRNMGYDNTGEKEEDHTIIIGDKSSIFNNSRGMDVFQTSIHYTLNHLNLVDDKIKILPPSGQTKCPLFVNCLHEIKNSAANTCCSRPWSHPPASGDGADCAYQLAVLKANLKNCKASNK